MIRRLIAQLFQTSFMPFIGVGGMGQGYEIEKSLRFRREASATVARTFLSAGNRKTWTLSVWVKRGALGSIQYIFSGGSGTSDSFLNGLKFETNDCLYFVGGSGTNYRITTAVFRDPAAWYHIVLAFDTTQAEPLDRIKLYVNGVEQSFSSTTAPTLNLDYGINAAGGHRFGNWASGSSYLDGYLADINFIDGQALGPEVFGQVNPITGQWEPKKYTGTYGANGFYLDFKDGTNLTTLGQDKSGNGNHWTLNNISLTDGPAYGWMDDTPSNNFAVLNPLVFGNPSSAYIWGNLRVSLGDQSNGRLSVGSIAMSSGKWYFEAVMTNASGNAQDVGILGNLNGVNVANISVGSYPTGYSYGRVTTTNPSSSFKRNNGTTTYLSMAVPLPGDIIGVCFDADSGELSIYLNGVSQGVLFSGIPTGEYFFAVAAANHAWDVNFGQRPFAYTPPPGYQSLCTKNLKDDTVNVSGSFTGNANANGPFIWCNGTPETLTINGNAVTWGTHADRLANGFKLRTNSASYNASGTNNWTATILSPPRKSSFRNQRAKVN